MTMHIPASCLLLSLICCCISIPACKKIQPTQTDLSMEDIFDHPPLTITAVSNIYQSKVTGSAIMDMNESILCLSTEITEKSFTYFIQPEELDLKHISFDYKEATIADLKYALLFADAESGKTTLIYLPGRFPLDSLKIIPDVTIPVMGITRYHSEIEQISSRWTEIVCKCVGESQDSVIYRDRTIHECDHGGPGLLECTLTTDQSITSCETQCRTGALACCWFEF